jgi:hypothetical protein
MKFVYWKKFKVKLMSITYYAPWKNKSLRVVVLFCVVITVCIAIGFSSFSCSSIQNRSYYLLDRIIQWSDGSTEHVQIGYDGFFRLNDVKKRLVGMNLSKQLPDGSRGQFYLPDNLKLIDKNLAYLESAGVRLVRVELPYVRGWLSNVEEEKAAYTSILDLAYKHKMLVIPGIYAKWLRGFATSSSPDFSWGVRVDGKWNPQGDSLEKWARRWTEIVKSYPNVIAINAENELDIVLNPVNYQSLHEEQKYSAKWVKNYMAFLTGILRHGDVPLTHNLVANHLEPEIKETCIKAVDIPAFDCYFATADELEAYMAGFLPSLGITSGWWCLELNRGKTTQVSPGNWENVIDVTKFDVDYVDEVFDHGAAIAVLFWSSDNMKPGRAFFDDNGNPKPQLREIVSEIERLQAPLSEPLPSSGTGK